MLKKRLIGVVTVKNGRAVQSFGYCRYLPLGTPEFMVENLDRWGADEILIQVIDRSVSGLGPDLSLMKRIGELGLETPLAYAGGVRSAEDGIKLVALGADRIVVDTLLRADLSSVKALASSLGSQALVASLPMRYSGNQLEWLDYRTSCTTAVTDDVLKVLDSKLISEALLIDFEHEGKQGGFDMGLIGAFPIEGMQIIAFGGISESRQMKALFCSPRVAAVAVGNFLSYREHAFQKYKNALRESPLRPATYRKVN